MKRNNGFSLIEMMIVLAILGIMVIIATFSWRWYQAKTNLRSAAREVASDFAKYKTRALAEGRVYTITFNAVNTYNITAPVNDNLAAVNVNVAPTEASAAQDALITASDFTGCSIVNMLPRGLVQHCAVAPNNQNPTGSVTLTNSLGATATITLNNTGTAYVTFTNP